jgi:hypothetical protein
MRDLRSARREGSAVRYSSAAMSSPRARNQVTPDDVGKRVSFQFELPNGYVGEAVGVLEHYDEDAATYLVRKKDGALARVPTRGVRFGKIVPPA